LKADFKIRDCADKPPVDRRTETRIDVNQEIYLTVLSDPSIAAMSGHAVDLSGRGIAAYRSGENPDDAAVKIEMADR